MFLQLLLLMFISPENFGFPPPHAVVAGIGPVTDLQLTCLDNGGGGGNTFVSSSFAKYCPLLEINGYSMYATYTEGNERGNI